MDTQRIYVVSFAPSYDESSIGGCEWRRSRAEAVAVFSALAVDDGADFRLTVLDLPAAMTAEEIDSFFSFWTGSELVDPPDPRTDLEECIAEWRADK